ncbi:hypothetical protein F4778DRAFT_763309 [Xylariomycetidae sp. FL2044]|nr:hypothetical protein F4778DRAFT_763309 [Xylariomycetidae sp. FL2044]
MSEYWKSTPKYWCKHCEIYVRDTKLERTNHESTAKHQSALKRFLRDLHRTHDQELREKERAKREVQRLNGVVSASSSASSPSTAPGANTTAAAAGQPSSSRGISASTSKGPATAAQRQKQWEQLADMGIDVPTELRGDMAMASEWTVTNTRVIDDTPKSDDPDLKPGISGAVATGVRKRSKPEGGEEDEHQEEEEKAIKGLFKKPRKWGRDTKHAAEDDAELDALLRGTLTGAPKKEEQDTDPVKKEDPDATTEVKKEESDDVELPSTFPGSAPAPSVSNDIKKEDRATEAGSDVPAPAAVVFKKRKPKNIRQK